MSIRLLVVLGALVALTMASESPNASPVALPSASHTSKKGGKGGKPKGTKSKPKGTKSNGKPAGPPPPPPPPKECGPPYDKGCPCYNQKDVDALLAFAAESEGNCSYYNYNSSDIHVWEIFAYKLTESNETYRYLQVVDYATEGTEYETDYCVNYYDFYKLESYFSTFDEFYTDLVEESVTTTCADLIEDVKDQMKALNCSTPTEFDATILYRPSPSKRFDDHFGGKR